jgi:hypothetical protein
MRERRGSIAANLTKISGLYKTKLAGRRVRVSVDIGRPVSYILFGWEWIIDPVRGESAEASI